MGKLTPQYISQNFEAAIFDLDGTLLDSMWVWSKIDCDFLAKRNLPVEPEYTNEIPSKTFYETAVYTIEYFGFNETPEEIMAEWTEMAAHEYAENIKLKSGVYDYLTILKSLGVKLGIATSLTENLYRPCLINNGIYGFFDSMTSCDEVKRGKGYPDVFLLESEKLNVKPEKCIAFDDVLKAIDGIKAAGMTAVGVYDKDNNQDMELLKKSSDFFVKNFSEYV